MPLDDIQIALGDLLRYPARIAIALWLVAGFMLSACNKQSSPPLDALALVAPHDPAKPACKTDVAEWTEEVSLHDGQMITVWRRARACVSGFPNAQRGRDIDFELRYEALGVRWTGSAGRIPIAFDIVGGVPYLVLDMGDRESCQSKPPSNYLAHFLAFREKQWHEVPQSEVPVANLLLNLHTEYWGHTARDDAKGLVSWESKYTLGKKGESLKDYYERVKHVCSLFQTR